MIRMNERVGREGEKRIKDVEWGKKWWKEKDESKDGNEI